MAASAETTILELDQKISGAADVATGALGRLENQINREENALARLEQSLQLAKNKLDDIASGGTKGVVDLASFRKQQMAVGSLSDKIGGQKDKLGALGEKLTTGEKRSKQFSETAKLLGKETGLTTGKMGALGGALGKLGPYGAAAAAGILILAAVVTTLAAIIWKGISAAGAMRSEMLKLRDATVNSAYGFNWLYNSSRASTTQAEQMQSALSRVAGSSDLARDKLTDYAVQIRKAGFMGKNLETVLKGMATAGTGGNEDRAKQFLEMARTARIFGGSIDTLAARVEKKLGSQVKANMLSLDVQMAKLGENINRIFGGAAIEPFLRGLQAILSFLDADSASGKGLEKIITSLVEKAIGLFLRFELALLNTYIWLRKHDAVWKMLKFVVASIGVAFLVMAAVVALAAIGAAISIALIMLPIFLLGAAIYGLVWIFTSGWDSIVGVVVGAWDAIVGSIKSAWDWIVNTCKAAWNYIKIGAAIAGTVILIALLGPVGVIIAAIGWLLANWDKAWNWITTSAPKIGQSIIDGIVNGIKNAGSAIWEALKGAIGGAIDSVKSFLGISSPSKLFEAQIGYQMAAGTAAGVESGSGEVAQSAEGMASGAASAAASVPSALAAAPSKQFSFVNCVFGDGLSEEKLEAWFLGIMARNQGAF